MTKRSMSVVRPGWTTHFKNFENQYRKRRQGILDPVDPGSYLGSLAVLATFLSLKPVLRIFFTGKGHDSPNGLRSIAVVAWMAWRVVKVVVEVRCRSQFLFSPRITYQGGKMQRVFCSTVLVAALSVAGLTACGDKVNVTQPPPDSAVTQVTVTPSSQNMNVGDKVTLVATVIAGPQQTNRNVTWTSSDATVASVDAAGVVTANKGGVATIIATSAANPAIKGNAVITVAAQVLASVTVGQINQTVCVPNGACTSVPAVLNNVHDQLDVTLNVDPGTQKISEVDLIMNCGGADTVVQKQTFATADVAPDAEDASAPTTLSFNTAAFNPTTGAVAFKNGQCTIKAKAITTSGTQVASGSQTLTLNNVDFISATTTTTPSTNQVASAPAANGLVWRAGAVNVTAIPVIYSNTTIASANISLVVGSVDGALGQNGAALAYGAALATLSNLTPASGVITASFPNSTSATAGVGGSTVDTLFTQVTTVSSTGNAGPTITLPAIVAPATAPAVGTNFIRLDNRAPDISTAPVVNFNVENNLNNWLGSAFTFTTTGT
ncbi:MAG TPA: Ig-like domain-containing protein, partial [Gemmatimonadaceae bacterium]|nr:Ig-like domain-containing protein [Gemmatimonadaceae bacterium]